jgi:stress response protein SCP2
VPVRLSKGQGVSLRKDENDLSQVRIGLGWDVPDQRGGLLGGLFGKKKEEYDLDVVAFLCNGNGHVANLGNVSNKGPVGGDVIFFNSLKHPSGHIYLTGDNRTGSGEGDDEQIIANLNALPDQYQKIVFVVQIYQGAQRSQSFGKVKSAYIRATDRNGKEMARYDLSSDATYANARSMIFAELDREASGWKLKAVGEPFETDSFVTSSANVIARSRRRT